MTTAWRTVQARAPRPVSWAALAYSVGALCIVTTLSVLALQLVELGGPADLDALQAELTRAAGETVHPAQASLWLKSTR